MSASGSTQAFVSGKKLSSFPIYNWRTYKQIGYKVWLFYVFSSQEKIFQKMKISANGFASERINPTCSRILIFIENRFKVWFSVNHRKFKKSGNLKCNIKRRQNFL